MTDQELPFEPVEQKTIPDKILAYLENEGIYKSCWEIYFGIGQITNESTVSARCREMRKDGKLDCRTREGKKYKEFRKIQKDWHNG